MQRHRRLGMTLVELLVVVTIIGILGGIIALAAPRFREATRVGQGTSEFKNWLENARLRAQRDKAPRGVRILDKGNELSRFVYVEQPDDLTGMPAEIIPVPATLPLAQQLTQTAAQRQAFQSYVMSKMAAGNPFIPSINPAISPNGWRQLLWLKGRNLSGVVNASDVLEFGGARYQIVNDPIPYPTPTNATDSVLVLHRMRDEARQSPDVVRSSPLPAYRITRGMRPIAGEPELTLPVNVAADLSRCVLGASVGGGGGVYDIAFSPSGEIIGSAGSAGRVIFWLRDVSLGEPGANKLPLGDNRLVVLHCRTGQITTHPVDQTVDSMGLLTDPYSFVRDGKSSNLKDE